MGCNSNTESAGPICGSPLPQINQGTTTSEEKTLNVTLTDANTGKPIDLTGATVVTANFPATNTPGFIAKVLGSGVSVIAPATLGQIQIVLSPSDVALLTPGVISFTINLTTPIIVSGIAQFLNSIQVNQAPFPGA